MKKKNMKSLVGMFCVLAVLVILVVSIWHKLVPNAQAAVLVVAPNEAKAAPEKKDDDKDKKIQLSDKVIADAHVRVEPAMKEVLVAKLSVAGEILADPDKSARVTSPVAGRVERIAVKEGDTVKRGDVLAVVRVPELGKARATHAAAFARATAARSNADRLHELADHGLAAKQEALNAGAGAVALARDAQAAQEQLGAIGSGATGSGSELALRAPIGGVVTRRSAVVGQAVSVEDTLATIVDLGEVFFVGRVYEKDLGRIELGRGAAIATSAYPHDLFRGKVEYLGREADPGARTFSARIRLANPNGLLRVGLFGSARIDTAPAGEPQVVVPRSAILEVEGKPIAFVKEEGGFAKRDVVLGAHDADETAIVSGIEDGDNVVVDGAFTLKSVLLKDKLGDDD